MTAELAEFAKTGFFARIRPDAQITRFQVLGERSSGTNYASRLIGKNTSLDPDTPLGWKHGFPDYRDMPADLLIIAMVRHAGAWSRSMHKRPWHTRAEMQKLEFSEFLRATWDTSFDHAKYFPDEVARGLLGAALTADLDQDTGAAFDNVFALRRAKLTALLAGASRPGNFILLRMEPMIAEPEPTLMAILDAARVSLNGAGYRGIFKRLGTNFNSKVEPRPKTPNRLSEDDRVFMRSQLDADQERLLGYSY